MTQTMTAEMVAIWEQCEREQERQRQAEIEQAWQWLAQQRLTNQQRAAQNARLYEQGENPADLDAPGA